MRRKNYPKARKWGKYKKPKAGKAKKSITIGDGVECPKCGKAMERREPLKVDSYSLYFDYCRPCGHIQHYQHAKNPLRKTP